MPAVNERVAYRSWAGDIWDAVITDVQTSRDAIGDTRVTIAIDLGREEAIVFRAIRWYDDPDEPQPGARPKKEADAENH